MKSTSRAARGSADMVRRTIAATAFTGVAAFVAACSSPGSPSPAKTVTVTAKPSPSHASPAVNSGSPAQATSGPPGPAPCATRSLQVKLGPSQGAAGSTYVTIDFTNISNVSCTLYGYPGVSLTAGKANAPVGLTAAENSTTARQLVILPPGQMAHAVLRIVDALNYPAARCHPVKTRYLQIYPPNQTTPAYIPVKTETCAKPIRTMTVDAVRPGAG